jgi:hypothetical protein
MTPVRVLDDRPVLVVRVVLAEREILEERAAGFGGRRGRARRWKPLQRND